jgi:hypothetical protein
LGRCGADHESVPTTAQQLKQLVKKAILGYSGPKKWRVSNEFIDSLSAAQREAFQQKYEELSGGTPDVSALLKAAKLVKANYSIAGELMTPSKEDRLGSSRAKKRAGKS